MTSATVLSTWAHTRATFASSYSMRSPDRSRRGSSARSICAHRLTGCAMSLAGSWSIILAIPNRSNPGTRNSSAGSELRCRRPRIKTGPITGITKPTMTRHCGRWWRAPITTTSSGLDTRPDSMGIDHEDSWCWSQ